MSSLEVRLNCLFATSEQATQVGEQLCPLEYGYAQALANPAAADNPLLQCFGGRASELLLTAAEQYEASVQWVFEGPASALFPPKFFALLSSAGAWLCSAELCNDQVDTRNRLIFLHGQKAATKELLAALEPLSVSERLRIGIMVDAKEVLTALEQVDDPNLLLGNEPLLLALGRAFGKGSAPIKKFIKRVGLGALNDFQRDHLVHWLIARIQNEISKAPHGMSQTAGALEDYLEHLLKQGLPAHVVDESGDTPLLRALRGDCFIIQQLLLNSGRDLAVDHVGLDGLAASHLVAMSDYRVDLLPLLQKAGADLAAMSPLGTPRWLCRPWRMYDDDGAVERFFEPAGLPALPGEQSYQGSPAEQLAEAMRHDDSERSAMLMRTMQPGADDCLALAEVACRYANVPVYRWLAQQEPARWDVFTPASWWDMPSESSADRLPDLWLELMLRGNQQVPAVDLLAILHDLLRRTPVAAPRTPTNELSVGDLWRRFHEDSLPLLRALRACGVPMYEKTMLSEYDYIRNHVDLEYQNSPWPDCFEYCDGWSAPRLYEAALALMELGFDVSEFESVVLDASLSADLRERHKIRAK